MYILDLRPLLCNYKYIYKPHSQDTHGTEIPM